MLSYKEKQVFSVAGSGFTNKNFGYLWSCRSSLIRNLNENTKENNNIQHKWCSCPAVWRKLHFIKKSSAQDHTRLPYSNSRIAILAIWAQMQQMCDSSEGDGLSLEDRVSGSELKTDRLQRLCQNCSRPRSVSPTIGESALFPLLPCHWATCTINHVACLLIIDLLIVDKWRVM